MVKTWLREHTFKQKKIGLKIMEGRLVLLAIQNHVAPNCAAACKNFCLVFGIRMQKGIDESESKYVRAPTLKYVHIVCMLT